MSTATSANSSISLSIDGHEIQVAPGQTVLHAARKLGIDIPTLCYLEKCGPLNSCLVCLVKINGKLVPSCGIPAQAGMKVESETPEVHEARRTALELLFSDHVGDCLSPCQRLCPLRMNIPVMIRQLQTSQVEAAVKTVRDALPLPAVLGRLCNHPCEQGCRRATADETTGIRDMERFAADYDLGLAADATAESANGAAGKISREPYLPRCKKPSGKSVAIIGAGPAGLTAAYTLLRHGHSCTIADRREQAGGTLRDVNAQQLPPSILDVEILQLKRLGAQFTPGTVLGHDLTLDGLLRGFDAVLVTVGELAKADGESWGLEMAPGGIKINPDTYQTNRNAVFAAGRAVKPVNQLVRAMAEGQWAAECIHLFLGDRTVQRPDKPFSSIMGRLEPQELQTFVKSAKPGPALSPCSVCSGFTKAEAAEEAARCLRCDCRASGNCALQSYATIYGADASRFRSQRRPFEQYVQHGGVIFEPGKCILCGICVKLTEMAREPLGLTFIGRGFDVRIATPFNQAIEAGLQKVAEECVRFCPTGALEFRDPVTGPIHDTKSATIPEPNAGPGN